MLSSLVADGRSGVMGGASSCLARREHPCRKEGEVEMRATRRRFLGSGVSIGTGALLVGSLAIGASRVGGAQDSSPIVGDALPPGWRFTVRRLEDPYMGELLRPEERAAGTRYVGAEVTVANESQAPLNLSTGSIRLRDVDGVEYSYSPGAVAGSEPRIQDINMIPGEQAAGWVWYAVPDTASLVEMVYVAPPPRLTVMLRGAAGVSSPFPPSLDATPAADD